MSTQTKLLLPTEPFCMYLYDIGNGHIEATSVLQLSSMMIYLINILNKLKTLEDIKLISI